MKAFGILGWKNTIPRNALLGPSNGKHCRYQNQLPLSAPPSGLQKAEAMCLSRNPRYKGCPGQTQTGREHRFIFLTEPANRMSPHQARSTPGLLYLTTLACVSPVVLPGRSRLPPKCGLCLLVWVLGRKMTCQVPFPTLVPAQSQCSP